ncbi:heavy metal translocating P-type ATPase [Kineococcus gynurae]|uniref:Heavy metal translocating P-type ATPase n=1 Tax=Kineococcus gynurae TaxID=452979 RepID=A0ABV5LS13_9ACTN
MSGTLTPVAPAARTGRDLPRPPSVLRTGARLPEVRWAGLALALFLLGGALQLGGAPTWASWGCYLACYLAGGWEPAWSGLQALRERVFDVDLLMVLAAVAAAAIGQVLDGALLVVIFATSGAIEAVITQRTADSVTSLLGLAPERATRVDASGAETELDVADLAVGDLVLVRPGERIGADGTVVEGVSEVDQQAVTGESVPVPRAPGDEVLSGTVNGTGSLRVRVGRAAGDSVIARVVALVEQASATKARTQVFVERIEQRYSLGVVVATLLVLLVPLTLLGATFDAALLRAITFMIVASPCAVVLATMPPLLSAMANAGRHGVLVKSATVMEAVGRSTVFAFDKTGTLTEGAPEVTAVVPTVGGGRGLTPEQVLRAAAAVEQDSEHPLGRAVVAAARERGLPLAVVEQFRAVPGIGVAGRVGGHEVRVERAPVGVDPDAPAGTTVVVRLDGVDVGTITLVDRVRPGAAGAVGELARLSEHPVLLLTGDGETAAGPVAARTGIGEVRTRLLPEDKAAVVAARQEQGERVLLVGDGVNDAPALATAAVGVAMGRHGSDLALDTADVVVVRDELEAIPRLVLLSRRARRIVVANLATAATFIVTLVAWDLLGHLPLPLAVAGHEGSTVVVALNGLRLLRARAWTG